MGKKHTSNNPNFSRENYSLPFPLSLSKLKGVPYVLAVKQVFCFSPAHDQAGGMGEA